MGRRGPLATPNHLKLLAGNPGKRPLKPEPPQPRCELPKCPSWLAPEAKREWKRLGPELARLGLLTSLDAILFAGYCETYVWWRKCKEVLDVHGTHYLDGKGRVRTRPEVAIARAQLGELRELALEFGLTPAARMRLALPGPEEEPDEFELFLRGGQPQRRD